MKNKLLLSFLTCLSSYIGWAQNKSSLALSLGPAIPVGEFANKDGNDIKSGLANTGWLGELSFSLPIRSSHFSVAAAITGRLNGIDQKASKAPFEAEFPTYEWSVSNSHWKALSAMAGATYLFPLSSKIDIGGTLLAGVANTYLSTITVQGIRDTAHTYPTDLIQANVGKAHATTFSAMVKAGIVYHLNARWNVLANVNFWYLQPTFRHVTQSVIIANGLIIPGYLSVNNASSISYSTYTRDYKQNMNSVNFTAGVAFRL